MDTEILILPKRLYSGSDYPEGIIGGFNMQDTNKEPISILLHSSSGVYNCAEIDYNCCGLIPTGETIDRSRIELYGLPQDLSSTKLYNFGFLNKDEGAIWVARSEAFSELVEGLEQIVQNLGSQGVLVQLTADARGEHGWIMKARAMAYFYRS